MSRTQVTATTPASQAAALRACEGKNAVQKLPRKGSSTMSPSSMGTHYSRIGKLAGAGGTGSADVADRGQTHGAPVQHTAWFEVAAHVHSLWNLAARSSPTQPNPSAMGTSASRAAAAIAVQAQRCRPGSPLYD